MPNIDRASLEAILESCNLANGRKGWNAAAPAMSESPLKIIQITGAFLRHLESEPLGLQPRNSSFQSCMAPGWRATGSGFNGRITGFVWIRLEKEVLNRIHENYLNFRVSVTLNIPSS